MNWNLVVTDLNSRNRAFLNDWESISVTRRVGSYCEGETKLNIYDKNAAEIIIGQRAIKFYRGTTLQLYGTIWEPLEISHPDGITIAVRDPYAYYSWRRNRAVKTYTAQDAGAIVSDRISIQNGFASTHLIAGSIATSVNRTLTVNPGKMEAEQIEDLSNMSSGFFFKITPVDGTPGTFAQLDVNYPNAGVSREECRFEYGTNTRDNLKSVKVVYNMPRNREVAASSGSSGGRIISISEDTTSQALYQAILEDEIAVSDITDTTILLAFAAAEIRANAPLQFEVTPNDNAPLLFQDFDVGDFVRLIVKDGADSIYTWVRVVEATLNVDKDGTERMGKLVVESLIGGKPYTRPEDLYREYLDDIRARQEMLERKVENITASTTAPPSSGAGSTPGADPTYTPPADPTPAPPPPTPTPDPVPVIPPATPGPGGFAGMSVQGLGASQIQIDVDVISSGQPTAVSIRVDRIGYLNTLVQTIDAGTGGDRHVGVVVSGLSRDTTYYVTAYATNSAGQVSAQASGATLHND